MSRAVIRAARGGLGGRRLQAVVIGLVVLACTAASVLALGMLVDTRTPFDSGFVAQHGADVTADMSLAAASSAQLGATAHAHGVTAVAGPYPAASVTVDVSVPGVSGSALATMHVVGRSRPGRTAVTAVAILFGAVAVTFGVGLSVSLSRVYNDLRLSITAPLRVHALGNVVGVPKGKGQPQKHMYPEMAAQPGATAAQQAAITAALNANRDIAHWVPETDAQVNVTGLSAQAQVTAFDGDASWTGYAMIKGSWYGPGSIDVNTFFLTATGASVGSTVTLTDGGRSATVRIAGEIFSPDNGAAVYMGGADLARIDPGQAPDSYYAGVKPDADPRSVANTVVLQLRERVHDLGVFKSVGMTPRQAIAMVVCSVTMIGLAAGIVAVPLGVLVHHGVLPVMAHAANTGLPSAVLTVYPWWLYVLLALAGLVIAVAAALGPASWAARTRTAFALRAE